ncbi:MAG: hypothetical protein NC037_06585 [Bacteroides sp.]|nr:hypothetical protein [Bacillota bacterium]MCM1394425.1 hypothetical protein [[Eubacterium] siraeum]MCM1456171.1 hypothetical protein [Bacteroides sp.]
MSKKIEQSTESAGERAFRESVLRFADAFIALSEDEKEELLLYTEGRRKEAEEEYKKIYGNKKDEE